jgi:IS30 family transposase
MQTATYPASLKFESAILYTGAGFAINAVRISSHNATVVQDYFTNPYISWDRPTTEDTSGLLSCIFQKGLT